ncbi:MAG: hypothetical protein ACFFDW_12550 [Candidatus Thorarchaeota archaeon]
MKKSYLIICIIFLAFFYQTNIFSQSITNVLLNEKIQNNIIPNRRLLQQTNGIRILSPQDGEVIKGLTTIEWTFVIPFNQAEIILSNVYYSSDFESNWIQLAYNVQENYFDWNTTLYEEYGTEFKLLITAESKNWTEEIYVISEGTFTIDNRIRTDFPWYLYIIIPIAVIIIGSSISFVLYRYKQQKQYQFDFLINNQNERIKALSQKVVIGLDNIKGSNNLSSELLIPSGEVSLENGSIIKFFPNSFHNELKSEIKGRTVMVLIEIAYQNPSETNPIKIAEGIGIPSSTLSKEIKKLISLNYIEYHISNQVLQDARYRNFKITKKGFEFLNILNAILKDTLQKIKSRNGSSSL